MTACLFPQREERAVMSDTIQVLVVDDDPEDAHMVALALRGSDQQAYHVKHVRRLFDAIALTKTTTFDIVLLDLGLPDSQGLETLDRLQECIPSTPVVVVSGFGDEETAVRSLERHAQDYVFKGDITPQYLSRSIRYAIQRKANSREIDRLISTIRENEETLLRKNERLKALYETAHAFVDNVSHEFRTPLTVIKEYVSLVRDGTMGEVSDTQCRFLRIVEDRANDLNTMVDDMLDVSRLESGLLCVRRKTHMASDIVHRVLPSLRQKAIVKDLQLDVDVPLTLPLAYCDGEKVERVLINLAINAMKFSQAGGHVLISARAIGNDLVFSVKDSGAGIARESLELIFERFKQAETDLRSSTKGFGLGLAIAKELVDLNLGRLSVESEPNVGSTFSFTVPLANPTDVLRRYLRRLARSSGSVATIVTASVSEQTSDIDSDDLDVFFSYLVRANDLAFRHSRTEWFFLLPEPESEARLFVERTQRELQLAGRNRLLGSLPDVTLRVERSWTDLAATSELIIHSIENVRFDGGHGDDPVSVRARTPR